MKTSDNMNEDQNIELRVKFMKYATDESSIRIRDFFQLSKEMNLPLTDLEFNFFKVRLEVDQDSVLSYEEFLFWAFRKQIDLDTEQEMQHLFKRIDSAGKGLICAQDLLRFLSGLAYTRPIDPAEVDLILSEADIDQDGFLNY
jgi:Ca2+-binding EF-hand superfamily protein